MRTASLVLALFVTLLGAGAAVAAGTDEAPSISRHAAGPQPGGLNDPLGGPATPRVYGLGQPLIFGAGAVLLLAAAALGVYTLVTARPIDEGH